MIATKFVLALAVLVGQNLLSVQGSRAYEVEEGAPKSQLEEICNGETDDTLTVDQVISIAAELEQDSSIRCSENVRRAFKSMNDMIANARENGCTRETVKAITKSFPSVKDFLETLPQVLSRFVIAFAVSMSKHCKEVMTRTILENKQLEASDFEAMNELLNSDVNKILESVNDPHLLPGDLAALLPDDDMGMIEIEVELDMPAQLKAKCEKRFKPVYKQVVEPVIELARAGIDYPDDKFVEGMSKEAIDKLNTWSRIVFLCKTMQVVKSPKESGKLAGDESEIKQLEYEPVVQEGLKEIETFPDEELDDLIVYMQHGRLMEAMRKALFLAATDLTEQYVGDEELGELFVCVWPMLSESVDSSSDSSDSSDSDSDSSSDSDPDSPKAAARGQQRQNECEMPDSAEHASFGTVVATVIVSTLYPLTLDLEDMFHQN